MATKNRTIEVELSTTGLDAQGRPRRTPLMATEGGQAIALDAPPGIEPELEGEHMLINIGPQHPAAHGVLRLVLELDGETVVRCVPHVGYLHCGFEKLGEYRQYNQILPLTDREDYLNAMGNNLGMAASAERLFGIEITERCKVLRVIACELSRIMSHLVWAGTTSIDIGAFTPFLWMFEERENIYRLLDQWVGARLTTSLTRVGGMAADIPDGWLDGLRQFVRTFPKTIDEVDRMLDIGFRDDIRNILSRAKGMKRRIPVDARETEDRPEAAATAEGEDEGYVWPPDVFPTWPVRGDGLTLPRAVRALGLDDGLARRRHVEHASARGAKRAVVVLPCAGVKDLDAGHGLGQQRLVDPPRGQRQATGGCGDADRQRLLLEHAARAQLTVDLGARVPVPDVGQDLGLHEGARGVADELVLVGQAEVDHEAGPLTGGDTGRRSILPPSRPRSGLGPAAFGPGRPEAEAVELPEQLAERDVVLPVGEDSATPAGHPVGGRGGG